MANRKINLLFLWLIVEMVISSQSFSLRPDEDDAPIPDVTEGTVKTVQGSQQRIQVKNSINHQDLLKKMFNQKFPLTGVNVPDMTMDVDPFKRRKRDVHETENITKIHAKPESVDDGLCKRREFQLNFADISWDWILYPQAFDAGVCRGSCLSQNAPFINHNSNMRNLAYEKGLISKQEAPCCVPTKFRPVRIIYNDGTDAAHDVAMSDMIIEECGCI